jgi:hypothetical protein
MTNGYLSLFLKTGFIPYMDKASNDTKLFLEEGYLPQIVEDMPVRNTASDKFLVRSR